MRFTCTIEGLEANWLEFSDVWTRREGEELLAATRGDAVDRFIGRKCTGCYIEQLDAPALTDPKVLTWEIMGDLDIRLHQFVVNSLYSAYTETILLGNASARRSSAIVAAPMTTAPTNQMH